MNEIDSKSEYHRLRWQCRRGMLELDLLLLGFLDKDYANLDKIQKGLFTKLLDTPDQELLELLMGRATHKDMCVNELVKKIRKQHTH